MKKLMAIFALSIIGAALIGCGPKEEATTTDPVKPDSKMETKDTSQESPTTDDK